MKFCQRCGSNKSLEEFFSNKRRKDGVSTYCKLCQLEYQRERYAKPEIKRKHKLSLEESKERRLLAMRKYMLKKQYGLTLEAYDDLLARNDGKCWICGMDNGRTLHVDHNHDTGEVRGLLCYKCNVLLGYANEDTALLRKAIMYLSGNKEFGD